MPGHSHGCGFRLEKNTPLEQKKRAENNATTYQGGGQPHDKLRTYPQALGGIPPPNTTLLMMKIITWNIRGLNGRSKQRILRDCIKAENLDILMLQETKCVGAEAETIFQRFFK
jgi:hypothetical protein